MSLRVHFVPVFSTRPSLNRSTKYSLNTAWRDVVPNYWCLDNEKKEEIHVGIQYIPYLRAYLGAPS